MKEVFKKGLKIFYLLFIVNIMSFFLVISFNFITTIAFTEEIGYKVYVAESEDAKQEFKYDHYFKDGEDTKLKEYEEKGYLVNTPSLRSQPSKGIDTASKIIAGLICVFMAVTFIHNDIWKFGDTQKTAVKYKGEKECLFKGFYAGLIAVTPAVIFLLILSLGIKKSFPLLLYGILNTYLYDFLVLIAGANGASSFGDLVFWQILVIFLMLLIVPVFSGLSYILGYKDILISEKIIYKKTK